MKEHVVSVFEFVSWRTRRSRPAAAAAAPIEEVTVHEPAGGFVAVRGGDRPPQPEEDETWLDQLAPAEGEPEPDPELSAERVEPESEAEAGPKAEAEPTAEPQPAEPQPEVEEPEPEPQPEPEPEPEREPRPVVVAPQLVAVPEPDVEPEPVREPGPAATAVATLPTEFDALARESFGELLAGRAR